MTVNKKLYWILPFFLGLCLCTFMVLGGCSCSADNETTDDAESSQQDEATTQEGDEVGSGEQQSDQENEVNDSSEGDIDPDGNVESQAANVSKESLDSGSVSSASYYDICDEYVAEYREPTCDESESYSSLSGLCFAQLFDFDNDGTDELLIAYASDDAESVRDSAQSAPAGASSHYVIEVWKNNGNSVDRLYQGTSLITGEGSEAVAWGMSQYGGYVMSGQSGIGSTQYYYLIAEQGSSLLAEATWTVDDELFVNGEQAEDDWLEESVFNEYVLAGYGMTGECEKTLAAFNETLDSLK